MSGYRMGDRLPTLQYALGPCDRLAAEGLATGFASAEKRGTEGIGLHLSEESHVLGVELPFDREERISFLLGQSVIRVGRPNSSSFFWGNQKDSQDEGSSPQGDQPDDTHPPIVGVG